jgi:hypothetical protein|tara:strand:+ start:746 stop:958 length:213 start_codon:yes stop_codon:yes gene_type:complete
MPKLTKLKTARDDALAAWKAAETAHKDADANFEAVYVAARERAVSAQANADAAWDVYFNAAHAYNTTVKE